MGISGKRRAVAVFTVSALAAVCGALTLSGRQSAAVVAEKETLVFDSSVWTVRSGEIAQDGGSSVTVNKTEHAGDNKLYMTTKKEYTDFHLQYKIQYGRDNEGGDQWLGRTGIVIRGDASAENVDGFYIGMYGYSDNALYSSCGRYDNGVFSAVFGNHTLWDSAAYENNTVDVYVQGSHMNILINNWLYASSPIPYCDTGVISLYSDAVSATYSDITIEPLAENFDITSTLVRANFGNGGNILGEVRYWNESGKNQTFRMKLPDSLDGVENFWLVRSSKVIDGNQSVDVYVDKTATLGLADEWTDKVTTWGDRSSLCTHGNAAFGLNAVEIPLSAFDGMNGGDSVGFFLKKNINGWYSATDYYLLYRGADGEIRVADYFDLAYAFDTSAHSYVCDDPTSRYPGYSFFCLNDGLITSHRRGEKLAYCALPDVTKKKDIEHTFEFTDGGKQIDISEYIDINFNHTRSVVRYSVDDGDETDTLVLPPATKTGVVTVNIRADGSSNDASGAINYGTITLDIPYSTVRNVPANYINKLSDININVTGGGVTVDLLDHVETNIEGTWSFTVDGESVDGHIFTAPENGGAGEIVLTGAPSDGSEPKHVVLDYSVTAYVYPEKTPSQYYASCAEAPGKEWIALYGTADAVNGKWIADADGKWGILADFGTEKYAFLANVDVSTAVGTAGKYGFLVHAEIDKNGLSGLLIGLQTDSAGRLFCAAGWLDNGVYTPITYADTYFNVHTEYYVQLIADGSAVSLLINGYRIMCLPDKFGSGGKFAILNDGDSITYRNIKCMPFEGYIGDTIIRTDWKGADTHSRAAVFNGIFDVTFKLPDNASATNFRLVRRSAFDGKQGLNVSCGEKSLGTWTAPVGGNYGDAVFALGGFEPNGETATFTFMPDGTSAEVSMSYMWLVYEADGIDIIADSVYFGNAADVAAHGLGRVSLTAPIKQFISADNGMLITSRPGEKAKWAREIQIADKMQAKTFTDKSISSSVSLPYRLYLPENYDADEEYPLLLFLHGAGERGNDNISHIVAGNVMGTELLLKRVILGANADKFIIVAPQCPAEMRWVESDWTPGSYNIKNTEQSIPSKLVQSLLFGDIFENYSVDRSRVYGAGLSMGGFGITDLACRNTGLFAAVINCSGGADPSAAELLGTTALRAYHSVSDTTVNNAALERLVENIKENGGDAEYFEVNNIYHAGWIVGFEDPDLIPWMLAHRKIWTVKTELDGGTLEQQLPETYGYDTDIITLSEPKKDGYRFGGWYTDPQYKTAVTEFGGNTAADITLYAKWVKDVTVTVVSDGETLETKTVESGTEIDLGAYSPTKDGFVHVGWSDGTREYGLTAKVKAENDVTFTAIWNEIAAERFTVTVYYGTEVLFTAEVESGGTAEFTAPNKEGYEFKGLYSDASLTVPASVPQQITADITLYARYDKKTDEPVKPNGNAKKADGDVNVGLVVGLCVAGAVTAAGVAAAAVVIRRKRKNKK